MEMAFCEILFSQDCRLESPGRSMFWLGWLLLCRPMSVWKVASGDPFEAVAAIKKALSQRQRADYNQEYIHELIFITSGVNRARQSQVGCAFAP